MSENADLEALMRKACGTDERSTPSFVPECFQKQLPRKPSWLIRLCTSFLSGIAVYSMRYCQRHCRPPRLHAESRVIKAKMIQRFRDIRRFEPRVQSFSPHSNRKHVTCN